MNLKPSIRQKNAIMLCTTIVLVLSFLFFTGILFDTEIVDAKDDSLLFRFRTDKALGNNADVDVNYLKLQPSGRKIISNTYQNKGDNLNTYVESCMGNTCIDTCFNTCYGGTCDEYTCDGYTCDGTCDEHTCDGTCDEHTCDGTCDEHTCQGTCDEYTCQSQSTCEGLTCDTGTCAKCYPTSNQNTCYGNTCEQTCYNTCEQTCYNTCEQTCYNTCEPTCGSTCGDTCDKCDPPPTSSTCDNCITINNCNTYGQCDPPSSDNTCFGNTCSNCDTSNACIETGDPACSFPPNTSEFDPDCIWVPVTTNCESIDIC